MTTKDSTPNWRDIVEQLVKAEKEAIDWRAEATRADKEVARLKAALAKALRVGGGSRAQELVAEALAGKPAVKPARTRDTQRASRALQLMADRGGFLTLDELRAAEKCSNGAAHGVLFRLKKEGKVQQIARGRYSLVKSDGNSVKS